MKEVPFFFLILMINNYRIPATLVCRFLLKLRHKSVHGTYANSSPEEMSLSFVNRIQTRMGIDIDDFSGTTLWDQQSNDHGLVKEGETYEMKMEMNRVGGIKKMSIEPV